MKKNNKLPKLQTAYLTVLFGAIMMLASFSNYAQSEGDDWTLLKTENQVTVYVQEMKCGPGDWFVFKFENNKGEAIDFDYILNERGNVTFGNLKGSAHIKANMSKVGTCDFSEKMMLPINMTSELPLAERLEVTIIFNRKK